MHCMSCVSHTANPASLVSGQAKLLAVLLVRVGAQHSEKSCYSWFTVAVQWMRRQAEPQRDGCFCCWGASSTVSITVAMTPSLNIRPGTGLQQLLQLDKSFHSYLCNQPDQQRYATRIWQMQAYNSTRY